LSELNIFHALIGDVAFTIISHGYVYIFCVHFDAIYSPNMDTNMGTNTGANTEVLKATIRIKELEIEILTKQKMEILDDFAVLQEMYEAKQSRLIPASIIREKYQIFETTVDVTCAICLDPIRKGQRMVRSSTCGHKSHPECLYMWSETSSTCSQCRTPLINPFVLSPRT
jgi:hypothetical protein